MLRTSRSTPWTSIACCSSRTWSRAEDKPVVVEFTRPPARRQPQLSADQRRARPVEPAPVRPGRPASAVLQHQGRPPALADQADRRSRRADHAVPDPRLGGVGGPDRRAGSDARAASNTCRPRRATPRSCAKRSTRFAERAFRRPVTPAEVERFARLVEAEIASGEKFEAAVKTGLLAVLCSKDFLYLVEGSPGPDRRLNDWELASRLSYFLWSTMPDDALFDAARDGHAAPARGIEASRSARMLRDPKVARFAEAFPRQWLQLRRVGMFPPDKKLYPDYDDYLQKSMVARDDGLFSRGAGARTSACASSSIRTGRC